jgi:alpha-mannosidase
MAIADRALNYAVQSIAWNVNIPHAEGTRPLVVFNPHAWEINVNVEVEIGSVPSNPVLVDDEGHEVPMQFGQSEATTRNRRRMSFVAKLPPLGYRTYHVVEGETAATSDAITATDNSLENAHLKLVIDEETGFIQSLFDKDERAMVFKAAAARPVVVEDTSDTWSHDVTRFPDVIGAFQVERVQLVAHGPSKATLRVSSTYGQSRLVQDFSVYADQKRIDVHVQVDWREQFKLLKLRFPVNLIFPRITYEIPYGHIERAGNGQEEPGQSWIDISGVYRETGKLYGLSILNDAKYSYDLEHGEIGLTVLRSPIYAHHIPKEPSPDEEYSFIDQGIQRFNYVLLPHADGWEAAQTPRRAAELNQPPIALLATFHDGRLPQSSGYASVDAANIIISVLKQAEDNDDLILRAYETDKQATTTTIRLPVCGREFAASFAPSEIKTFRVPVDSSKPVVETDMLEWEEASQQG